MSDRAPAIPVLSAERSQRLRVGECLSQAQIRPLWAECWPRAWRWQGGVGLRYLRPRSPLVGRLEHSRAQPACGLLRARSTVNSSRVPRPAAPPAVVVLRVPLLRAREARPPVADAYTRQDRRRPQIQRSIL